MSFLTAPFARKRSVGQRDMTENCFCGCFLRSSDAGLVVNTDRSRIDKIDIVDGSVDLNAPTRPRLSFGRVWRCPASGDKILPVFVDGDRIGAMNTCGDAETPAYWCDGSLEDAGFVVYADTAAEARQTFRAQWRARLASVRGRRRVRNTIQRTGASNGES